MGKIEIINRSISIMLNSIHLFNARKYIEKILQIRLSLSKNLFIIFLCIVAQA